MTLSPMSMWVGRMNIGMSMRQLLGTNAPYRPFGTTA